MRALYLLDAHCLFYRSLYAPMGQLTAPDGMVVTGVFGFVRAVQDIWQHSQDTITHAAVCFDPKPATLLKRKVSADYKANRPAKNQEITDQLRLCRQLVKAMGLACIRCSGYEADDVIATLVDRFSHNPGIRVVVVTSDKDLMQLVNDHTADGSCVEFYDPSQRRYYKEADVLAKWGVLPSKMLDLQTLTGDMTDNVQGCRGIGPGTAAHLINTYGSLKKIRKVLHKLTPSKAKAIRSADTDLICQLVSLLRDAPVDAKLSHYRSPDTLLSDEAREMFAALGFRKALTHP